VPLPLNPEVRQLSLSDIAAEFGGDPPHRMSEYFAGGPYVPDPTTGTYGEVSPSGSLRLQIFYGTSLAPPIFTRTISTNLTNLNVRTYMLAQGWDGNQAVILTIDPNVWVYSTSTNIPAITTGSPFPNGLTIVNNGFIAGQGGTGGRGSYEFSNDYIAPTAGGIAISLGVNTTITNNGYIGGGGGGGAYYRSSGGGGGAGGGITLSQTFVMPGYATVTTTGATGGAVNSSGGNGTSALCYDGAADFPNATGGAGGRIFPGTGGAGGSQAYDATNTFGRGGGAGGGGAGNWYINEGFQFTGTGGAGGSAGNVGQNGQLIPGSANGDGAGGGGGWGASGGNTRAYIPPEPYVPVAGAAGGKAISLNGFVAIQNGSGTRYGAVS